MAVSKTRMTDSIQNNLGAVARAPVSSRKEYPSMIVRVPAVPLVAQIHAETSQQSDHKGTQCDDERRAWQPHLWRGRRIQDLHGWDFLGFLNFGQLVLLLEQFNSSFVNFSRPVEFNPLHP